MNFVLIRGLIYFKFYNYYNLYLKKSLIGFLLKKSYFRIFHIKIDQHNMSVLNWEIDINKIDEIRSNLIENTKKRCESIIQSNTNDIKTLTVAITY